MAKLVVNPTSTSRREIALGRTLVSIGRDPSNDLVLPDAMVSRRHAVIEFRGSQYYLRDCNSSNGSVVNGDRISEKNLRDGDMVAIGSARLLFREEVEASGKVVQHPSAPKLACAGCEAPYRKGDLFCRTCGARLPEPSGPPKAVCTECGTAVPLPAQFCNACGARLPGTGEMSPPVETPAAPLPDLRDPRDVPTSDGADGGSPGEDVAEAPAAKANPGPVSEGALARVTPAPSPPAAAARAAPAPDRPRLQEVDLRRPVPGGEAPARPAASRAPLAFGSGVGVREAASPPGPPGRRALAFAFDALAVLAGEALVMAPVAAYWWSREPTVAAADVPYLATLLSLLAVPLALAVGIAYYVWSWGIRGATPGQRWQSLAVEGQDGRFPIGVAASGVRLFGYLLSGLSLGVGFLLVPLTGSGLHDRIAGTRVVVRPRETR